MNKLRVLLIAINGIGIGHVVRCVRIGSYLRSKGHTPFLVVESHKQYSDYNISIGNITIPRLPSKSNKNIGGYLNQLDRIIDTLDPHIVIFDCHDLINEWIYNRSSIRYRKLISINSLPSTNLLEELISRNDVDITLLLHSQKEFKLLGIQVEAINSSKIRFLGGPILGTSSIFKNRIEKVKLNNEYILVLLGGGGEHLGKEDMKTTVLLLNEIAQGLRLKHSIQTVLVTGPNFSSQDDTNLHNLTCIPYVENPKRLAVNAKIAIIRPGFNLTRELYDISTPLILLKTYQYEEASEENFAFFSMRRNTLIATLDYQSLASSINKLLFAKRQSQKAPWRNGLGTLVRYLNYDMDTTLVKALTKFPKFTIPRKVLLRIDDVIALDKRTLWLLNKVLEYKFKASLEVIPSLLKFTMHDLNRCGFSSKHFEVSQHGFSHANKMNVSTKSEFDLNSGKPTNMDILNLRNGMQGLSEEFGELYKGGFSCPYDGFPIWLPQLWKSLGGQYISYIWNKEHLDNIKLISIGIESWDWDNNRIRTLSSVIGEIERSLANKGYVGIVLHPIHFESHYNRQWLEVLFNFLSEMNFEPQFISELARNQEQLIKTCDARNYSLFD